MDEAENIFKYIDIEQTIAEFGYDPRELSRGSNRKVFCLCKECLNFRNIQRFNAAITPRRCINCRENDKIPNDISPAVEIEKTLNELGYDPRFLKKNSNKKIFTKCISCKKIRLTNFQTVREKCIGCYLDSRKNKEYEYSKEEIQGINFQKTLEVYGYDPRDFGPGSMRKIFAFCLVCKKERIVDFCNSLKKKRCKSCSNKDLTEEQKRARSIRQKGRKISEETKEKLSALFSGKKMPPRTEEHKKNLSLSLKATDKNKGKNSPMYGQKARSTKRIWYIVNGEKKFAFRSSWESLFAEWLNLNGKNWKYEPKAFEITFDFDGELKQGTYRPDFYSDGVWYEVKGFWRKDAKAKFEAFKQQYPNEKITLLMKPELLALGIDVK